MRQCQKCGNMILDGQVACAKCGTPVQPLPSAQPTTQPGVTHSAQLVMGQPTMSQPTQPATQSVNQPTPTQTAATQPVQPLGQANPLSDQPTPLAQTLSPLTDKSTQSASTSNPLQSSQSLPPVNALEKSIDQITADQPSMVQPEKPKEPKKGFSLSMGGKVSKKTWILIGVCVAVLLIVVIVVAMMMSGGNKSGNSNNVPNTTVISETKVELGDYIITVPDGYSYEPQIDGSVDLTNDPENWIANFKYVDTVTYKQLADDFTTVATSYTQLAEVSQVKDAGTAEIGGRDYLYVDVVGTDAGVTGTYAYTKIGDNVLEIILETANKEFNHDLLEDLTPIVDGAEKNVGIENSFMNSNRTIIRLDLLSALANTSTEAQLEQPAPEVVEENTF